ncbi:MAG: TMEM165/GDT1 family protein [Spirochaetales bacterium]|nr:TMEM165/GDT1 family protein [Spirochaetales bacterium]
MKNKSLFLSTFLLVFLAELGDKTQIASFGKAAETGNILSVIIGGSLALIAATVVSVFLGHYIAKIIPERVLKLISGLFFIATGVVILISSLAG